MKDIIVLKREGDKEKFSIDKVIASVAKTGMSLKSAEEVGKEVENWVKKSAVDGKIRSADIRTKVVEGMKKIDQLLASTYDSYVK